jgi:hypothetical protein
MTQLFTVTLNDYKEIADYLAKRSSNRLPNFYLDFFNFWWDNNPAFSEDMERGWVLKSDEGIKGFIGVIPTFFQIGGEEKIIFNETHWFVSKDSRKYSVDLLYRRLRVSRDSISFSTTGSPRTSAIFKARRYVPMPRLAIGRSAVFFDSKKTLKKKLNGGVMLDPLISVGALAINQFQSIKLKTAIKIDTSHVRKISNFDDSFNDLWERTKNLNLNTNVRRANILQWFCFSNDSRKTRAFGYYEKTELLGYIILSLKNYEDNIWVCLDLWIDPKYPNVIPALLSRAVNKVKEDGGDMVIFNHFSDDMASACRSLGMLKFPSKKNELIRICAGYKDVIHAHNSYFVVQGDAALA